VHNEGSVHEMKTFLFSGSPRVVFLGVLSALLLAVPAQAATTAVDTSSCTEGVFSQHFLSIGDKNWYTPVGGQDSSGFNGEGWQLSNGAQIVTTTLPDGTTGSVLDLPSGARAVSPLTCVTSEYPTARSYVRNVKGGEGISFNVEYEGTSTWGNAKNTGQIHGANGAWQASSAVNLQPFNTAGWQPMRIVLVGKGTTSDFEVYDLNVDPRLGH
jgi:hypothetical protein